MTNEEYQNLDSENRYSQEEKIVDTTPTLQLPVDDKDLVSVLNRKIKASNAYFDTKKIRQRRKDNEEFYLGNQLDETSLYNFQQPAYKDNMIQEDEERRITMAAAQLPDIIVTGPDKQGSKILRDYLASRTTDDIGQRTIKDGLRIMDINFTATIKFRWDENLGETGDYVYELIDPNNIVFDHLAKIPHNGFTADNMNFVAEWIEEPLSVVVDKFPKKKDELMKALGAKSLNDTNTAASMVRYLEVWFTWYDKDGSIFEGVCWKYKDLILDKMKNPYWDWDGYKKHFLKKDNSAFEAKHVYNNFFERPRKPYIFFSEINLLKDALNSTGVIEQTIPLQKIINKRGRQITEISDNATPKKVFGPGLTKEQAAEITNDPNENAYIPEIDDVRKAIVTIPSLPPSPLLYQDKNDAKQSIDSKFSTNQASKGELTNAHMSGYSRQLAMQGDMTMANAIVLAVVNRVVKEMALWSVQLMKLFYDKEHYYRAEGDDGAFLEEVVTNDLIVDGIKIDIKANTVDKTTRKNNAMALMNAKAIDPLTMYEDMDVPDPKERAARLVAWNIATATGNFAPYLSLVGIDPSTVGMSPEPMTPMGGNEQEIPVQENIPQGG